MTRSDPTTRGGPAEATLTTGQAARICRVSPRTVSKWVDAGQLPGYRIPGGKERRIAVSELARFMRANQIPTDLLDQGVRRVVILAGRDDDAHYLAQRLLEFGRLEVHLAKSVFEAGVLAERHRPHAIVVDVAPVEAASPPLSLPRREDPHVQAASSPLSLERGWHTASSVEAASSPLLIGPSGGDAASTPSAARKSGGDAASTRGEDAASPPEDGVYTYFDRRRPIGRVQGGHLPHWRQEGVIYFVTWRTTDSMPRDRVRQWLAERDQWLRTHPLPHSEHTKAEYDRLFFARWEQWLDECHGECPLRHSQVKAAVEAALRRYDGALYTLDEFVVMPNHVHVLVAPLGENKLSDIEQSWKSYTAHAINKLLRRSGAVWQKESFDHIVRSPQELERLRQYIRENPRTPIGSTVEAASPPLSSPRREDPHVEAASSPLLTRASGGDAASTPSATRISGGDAASTKGGDAASMAAASQKSGGDAASTRGGNAAATNGRYTVAEAAHLARAVRGDARLPGICLIAVGSGLAEGDQQRLIHEGFDKILDRGPEPDELAGRIAAAIR